MIEIPGIKLDHLDVELIKIGDLVYHEGPLISHFVHKSNIEIDYLCIWLDSDNIKNRWLFCKISKRSLYDYLCQNITLREIVALQSFAYLVDMDDSIEPTNILLAKTHDILANLKCSWGNFKFPQEHFEPYAKELIANIVL